MHITCFLGLFCHGSHVDTVRQQLLAIVSFQMARKAPLLYEFPGTEVALVTFITSVDANVLEQVVVLRKSLAAVVTLVRAFACVNSLMPL